MDGNIEILRIKTFLSGDVFFLSDQATKRRRSYLLLGTILCQYLRYCIENDARLRGNVKSIEIKEDINVAEEFFSCPVEEEVRISIIKKR